MKIAAGILGNTCCARLFHMMDDMGGDEGGLTFAHDYTTNTNCYDEAIFLIEIMKALRLGKKRIIINVTYEKKT